MPANTTPPRPVRRAIAAAAAALLLSLGGLMVASPASAHDELVSTDPAADAVLDALPAQLTLTFSGELATDPGATELQVTDAAGTSLADGDPLVEGTVVTQALSGAASGVVTVLWKVVSSDGHPISGEFAFSVPTAPTPSPTPTATATASPSQTPVETATPEPIETAVPVDSGAASLPWILLAVIGVALLGGVTYLLVSRSRRQKALEEATAAGSATPPAPRSEPPADR
jgi:methionine-rich copper-binding protein CopC